MDDSIILTFDGIVTFSISRHAETIEVSFPSLEWYNRIDSLYIEKHELWSEIEIRLSFEVDAHHPFSSFCKFDGIKMLSIDECKNASFSIEIN